MTESVPSPDDLDVGAFQFTQKRSGEVRSFVCAPGLKAYEVELPSAPNSKAQIRVLTSSDMEAQDEFIDQIGSVVFLQRPNEVYLDLIDYGVDDGLTYYICNLDGYAPIREFISDSDQLSRSQAVAMLTRLLKKIDQAPYFDFTRDVIEFDSLWVEQTSGENDLVLADITPRKSEATEKANIREIVACYVKLSACTQIDNEGAPPQNLNQLILWLESQVEPPKTKWSWLDKFKPGQKNTVRSNLSASFDKGQKSLPKRTQTRAKANEKKRPLFGPSQASFFNLDSVGYRRNSNLAVWLFLFLFLVGGVFYALRLDRMNMPSIAAKMPRFELPMSIATPSWASGKRDREVQRAEGYQQPVLTLQEEVDLFIVKAAIARSKRSSIDAISNEIKALQLQPNEQEILNRIDSDLKVLIAQTHRDYTASEIRLLYQVALVNTKANDIIVNHFRTSAPRVETVSQEPVEADELSLALD